MSRPDTEEGLDWRSRALLWRALAFRARAVADARGRELASLRPDAEELRLLAAGWWRATNARGDVRWIHPSEPGWANDRETALLWLASNEEP